LCDEENVTPIVHSAIGLLGWQKSGERKTMKTLFWFILVANLPDIDFIITPLLGSGGLFFHQFYTHNFFFVSLSALLLFSMFKTGRGRLSLFAVAVSHLILDLIIIDPVAPVGFRVFFPLWNRLFNIGVFPNFLRGDLGTVFSWHNLRTVALEMVFFVLPVLVLCGTQTIRLIKKREFWTLS
jgi:hypothetical protein